MQTRPRSRAAPGLPALAALGLALLAGCQREEVGHYRVPKGSTVAAPEAPPPPQPPPGMPGSMPPGMPGSVPPPSLGGNATLRWTLPKGWTESKTGGMRFATLKPPATGRIDVSVTFLPGPAGGELANVNRWRGQIGLSPTDEASLAKGRKLMKTKAGAVSLHDLSSDSPQPSRMLAGLLTSPDGNTWFLKMVGDPKLVEGSRADFMRLLEGLGFDAAN